MLRILSIRSFVLNMTLRLIIASWIMSYIGQIILGVFPRQPMDVTLSVMFAVTHHIYAQQRAGRTSVCHVKSPRLESQLPVFIMLMRTRYSCHQSWNLCYWASQARPNPDANLICDSYAACSFENNVMYDAFPRKKHLFTPVFQLKCCKGNLIVTFEILWRILILYS